MQLFREHPGPVDSATALAGYEIARHRLPTAVLPASSQRADHLGDLLEHYDAFLLDGYGVLNRGAQPVPGAVDRFAQLRAAGRKIVVLTNGATPTAEAARAKYRALGFELAPEELVASREIASLHLPDLLSSGTWAAIAGEGDSFPDLSVPLEDLQENPGLLETADAFLFLSSDRWDWSWQDRLVEALRARPRPLVVANPDLVAPREDSLSVEPGAYAHHLADECGIEPRFFGKPFAEAFAIAMARTGIPPHRTVMVGDTLHTDVLGGAAAGCATVLVTDHGLFAGLDPEPFIERSGLRPHWIVPTT
jgi:HAD superfamily hydrolase (TIGR01459 family)